MSSNRANDVYAVIMAGGAGTRFWPLSRRRKPKQVLKLFDNHSLIQDTVSRLETVLPAERIIIVTNRQQVRHIAPQLPELSLDNYLLEPQPLNTAPCIGLAAIHIRHRNPEGIMVILPSDHLIRPIEKFVAKLLQATDVVRETGSLVTIGIPPTRPETGYGYIQFDADDTIANQEVFDVRAFAEKPNRPTAERFLQTGDFYWNSGIFIWKAKSILAEMEEHLPETYEELRIISEVIDTPEYPQVLVDHYSRIRPKSIDYGIMEVTRSPVKMLMANFSWSDVGSWDELYRISEKNHETRCVTVGDVVSLDSSGNYIYSPDRLTAVIGMKDLLVINTPTATLICPRERAQDVKELVEKMQKEGRTRQL